MPVAAGPPSPSRLSRYEDDEGVSLQPTTSMAKRLCRKGSRGDDADADLAHPAPMSPRVRKRLDEAKENASVFGPVCEQGEVVQWMTACHQGLREFGCDLERRGFQTLSSIAFLTEEELDSTIEPAIQQLLLATLARLRHEFFRM